MNTGLVEQATIYSEKYGMSIFPCRTSGKEPLTQHGCKDATRDPEQIGLWWSRWPNANIGVACGAASQGLLVLDVDGDEGLDSLRDLERDHGEVCAAQSITGRGLQYWFRTDCPFKNRVRLLPGLDLRSDGGYVVAPPSIHPNGRAYTWEVSARLEDTGLQPLPSWLALLLGREASPRQRSKPDSYWRSLVTDGVVEGERNQAVAQLAGHLLRRYVDPDVVIELVQVWNQCRNRPPLDRSEVERTIESIATAELRRRTRGSYVESN